MLKIDSQEAYRRWRAAVRPRHGVFVPYPCCWPEPWRTLGFVAVMALLFTLFLWLIT